MQVTIQLHKHENKSEVEMEVRIKAFWKKVFQVVMLLSNFFNTDPDLIRPSGSRSKSVLYHFGDLITSAIKPLYWSDSLLQ